MSTRTLALLGISALLCPLLAGCLGGYVYPTLAVAPSTRLGEDPADVHAFRIDVADQQCCICLGEKDRYQLTPLPLFEGERTLPQVKLALDHGYFFGGPGLIHKSHTEHSVRVRLYRQGFRTVEIGAWEKGKAVTWESADDLEDKEQAVDELVSTWGSGFDGGIQQSREEGEGLGPAKDAKAFHGLAPGRSSRGHRQALLFAAREYDRLALRADQDGAGAAVCARLEKKANALRRLAEE